MGFLSLLLIEILVLPVLFFLFESFFYYGFLVLESFNEASWGFFPLF